jgi:hypothetical protein
VVDTLPKLTGQCIDGSLLLTEARTHLEYQLERPAVATINKMGTESVILLEEIEHASLVKVSEWVVAYLHHGRLMGFHAKLAD